MTTPKLSDEELDLLERNDMLAINEFGGLVETNSADVKLDLEKAFKYLTSAEQKVMIAKLNGYNHKEVSVTKKFWTYHLNKAIEKLQKHLQ